MIGHEVISQTTGFPPSIFGNMYEPSTIPRGIDTPTNIFPEYIRIKQLVNSTGAEVTASIINIFFSYDIFNVDVITTPNTKLNKIKNCIGLNVTELASIFGVERPTIYQWLDANSNPNVKNKKRIDNIYNLFSPLITNNAIEFKKYLHNKTADGDNLYDLLLNADLNINRITILVKGILEDILSIRKKATMHESEMQNKGFKPVSKEQKSKVLNRIIRKIG